MSLSRRKIARREERLARMKNCSTAQAANSSFAINDRPRDIFTPAVH
jgi:hypothetical protein